MATKRESSGNSSVQNTKMTIDSKDSPSLAEGARGWVKTNDNQNQNPPPLSPSAREGESNLSLRGESMIENKINESDSSLQQNDSHNLDSRDLDSSLVSIAKNDKHTQPKLRPIIKGANGLSLGISIVVAILLGIGAGVLMQKIFGVFWVLFLGVAWGIAAAVLNVYKVYKAELRDFEKIADDIKYKANTR